MAEENKPKPIPIEELSAWSLYQVQRSLNEFEEESAYTEKNYRGGGFYSGDENGDRLDDDYDVFRYDEHQLSTMNRNKYKAGKGYGIEDEYRYLLAETDFMAEAGINSQAAADAEAAAQALLDAEPNRIDREYAEGIGIVNQSLDDATIADDIMGPPVDPTNRMIDAEPVSVSSPEESTGKLGGINSFKSAPAKVRTIKNNSINI